VEKIKNKVKGFLKKYGMDHEDIDIDKSCNVFLDEMEKGLAGQKSSLEMIPTYIETERPVPINEPVIAIDAGGTNFRVATVHFNEKREPVIERPKLYEMPGIKKPVTKNEFFTVMAGYVKDFIGAGKNIGFCFSYPTEIYPNKDGKLIRFSKEIKAKEVEGQMIGQNLNGALAAMGCRSDKHVVLLNDTVAALLAGRAGFPDRAFDSYVGFILGTGTNCCYVEQNKNIKKVKGLDPAKSQIINVESGGFAKAPRGKIDLDYDQSTINPGQQTFEKMISGAYFGPLCLRTINVAANDGLFSKAAAETLRKIKELSTKDISNFMYHPVGTGNPLSAALAGSDEQSVLSRVEGDIVTLYYLIDRLVERAAKLTAIKLSSAALKSGKGRNPCRPVCIVAEGTVFYQLKTVKQRVEFYLKQYLEEQKNTYYEIVNVENATLIGAAIAGLTN
jgi:hexokinase